MTPTNRPRHSLLTPLYIGAGLSLILSAALPAYASLKTIKRGKSTVLVASQFKGPLAKEFSFFQAKCTQCHDLHRPTYALTKGKTPLAGDAFDRKGVKKYVVKMMRKPNSGISRDDAKRIIKFLLAAKKLHGGG